MGCSDCMLSLKGPAAVNALPSTQGGSSKRTSACDCVAVSWLTPTSPLASEARPTPSIMEEPTPARDAPMQL